MDKISVIVPIYNCEQYLEQCLKSIISQSYQNLQIILVNDGSTDQSFNIAEHYHFQDSRIQVLNIKHSGAAQALNVGLAACDGDYVIFISALDFLGNNKNLEDLLSLINQHHSEIAVTNFFELNDTDGTTLIHLLTNYEKTYTPQEWFTYEYQDHDYLNQCFTSIYGKLFKTSLLNMVNFSNETKALSDSTTWQIYLMANKISYANRSMYVVRKNVAGYPLYHFDEEDHHSISAIEKRITILKMIDFNVNSEIKEYINRLKYYRDHSLSHSNYYTYLTAVTKLEIINKYHSN